MSDELTQEQREQKCLDIVNLMFQNLEPISYNDFNKMIAPKIVGSLVAVEKEHPEIGLAGDDGAKGFGTSTLALIATITDCLVGKRLAFMITDDDEKLITGVCWYRPKE